MNLNGIGFKGKLNFGESEKNCAHQMPPLSADV